MTEYPGPPPTSPQHGWQPRYQEQFPPPRELPELDAEAIDRAERTATLVTFAVGALAALVVLTIAIARLG